MDVIKFIFAGKASFKVGDVHSYLIEWKEKFKSYIVYYLNDRTGEYTRIGYYNKAKGYVSTSTDLYFEWFIDHALKNTIPENLSISTFHRCGRCGRKLKDNEEFFGKDCIKYIETKQLELYEHV